MKKRYETIKAGYSVQRLCGHKYFYEMIDFKQALRLSETVCSSCATDRARPSERQNARP